MISNPTRMAAKALAVLFPILVACTPAYRIYLQYGNTLSESDLETILAANPLGPQDNIKVTTLGKGEGASHHIVQVRDRETPHIHKNHDLTLVMLRGEGYLMLDGRRIDLTVGDIVFVPRAVPHYFVNTFRDPTVGLAVFSPPFDGKDTVPVGKP